MYKYKYKINLDSTVSLQAECNNLDSAWINPLSYFAFIHFHKSVKFKSKNTA